MLSQSKNVDSWSKHFTLVFYSWISESREPQMKLCSEGWFPKTHVRDFFYFLIFMSDKTEFALDQKLQGRKEAKTGLHTYSGIEQRRKKHIYNSSKEHIVHPQDSNHLGQGKTWRLLNRDQGQRELNFPCCESIHTHTHTHIHTSHLSSKSMAIQIHQGLRGRYLQGSRNPRAHAIWQIHWALSY